MKRSAILFSLVIFFLLGMFYPTSRTQAASASRALAPVAMVTLTGGASGLVTSLKVKDQSGVVDIPSKYVTFTTPGTISKNYRRFTLPADIATSSITTLNVTVNYKGLAKASQRWFWSLYDWTTAKWIYVGDNATAKLNIWTGLTFATTLPKRFVNASREIRLLVQSNNATGNAKLDFESIGITYTTPTPTRTATSAPAISSAIYGDALLNGWSDWSWDLPSHTLASTISVHSGTKSAAIAYTIAWGGLQFGRNDAFNISAYNKLRFWVNGGTSGGQAIQVSVSDGTTTLTKNITPQADTWTMVEMSLTGLSQATLIAWQNNTAGVQSTFYIDDVSFISNSGPTPIPTITRTPTNTPPPSGGPALNVNAGSEQHAISPYIYGMNFADQTLATELNLPVNRWGGNSTSRYNWETGNTNAGSDWYFENKSDGTHTDWINQNVATNTDSIITIPMLGYVAKDGSTDTCSFKVSVWGAQQKIDSPYHSNCGNGIFSSNGQKITGNNPLDTSIVFNANDAKSWVQNLVTTYGSANSGGVRFYDLDNEPELWSETHRDVHPTPESYDEIYNKGITYASAIKQADANAKTLGYVSFGWSGYWYSQRDMVAGASNGYTSFPDYESHDHLPQVAWYLRQMKQYETDHAIRLLDYLDLHYYPENGVPLTTAGDANKQALRLRSTRSLWDPTYIDESWIGGTDQAERSIHIIPRMHDWVNSYYPGTKLAMTEYNFGGLESLNGALTQADVLGIFGREELDLATIWDPPSATQPGSYAFRIYRNYDGNHNGFGNTSVHAASADQEKLAVYAALRSSDSALTLVVINKTGGTLTSALTLSGFTPSGNAQVYRYSAANLNAIQTLAVQTVSAGGFSATYPANSITLLVIPGNAP